MYKFVLSLNHQQSQPTLLLFLALTGAQGVKMLFVRASVRDIMLKRLPKGVIQGVIQRVIQGVVQGVIQGVIQGEIQGVR